jgi:AraC-like DNA-binding protein/quercetin dioxygenase-like cupin family protein
MAVSSNESYTDSEGREIKAHGTPGFPAACYALDFPGRPIPPHWHEELETLRVLRGSVRFLIGADWMTIPEGNAVFVNTNVLHAAYPTGRPAKTRSLVFSPVLVGGAEESVFWTRYLNPLLEDIALPAVSLSPDIPWQKSVMDSFDAAWQQIASEPAGYEIRARNALSEAVLDLRLSARAGERKTSREAGRRFLREQRLKSMLQYIHIHYPEEISLRTIAGAAAVSESECLRCFRDVLETTPMAYVRQYRLRAAARMLRSTGWPVSEIGSRCGFLEMGYFAEQFRKKYGDTPTAYRAKG